MSDTKELTLWTLAAVAFLLFCVFGVPWLFTLAKANNCAASRWYGADKVAIAWDCEGVILKKDK